MQAEETNGSRMHDVVQASQPVAKGVDVGVRTSAQQNGQCHRVASNSHTVKHKNSATMANRSNVCMHVQQKPQAFTVGSATDRRRCPALWPPQACIWLELALLCQRAKSVNIVPPGGSQRTRYVAAISKVVKRRVVWK